MKLFLFILGYVIIIIIILSKNQNYKRGVFLENEVTLVTGHYP